VKEHRSRGGREERRSRSRERERGDGGRERDRDDRKNRERSASKEEEVELDDFGREVKKGRKQEGERERKSSRDRRKSRSRSRSKDRSRSSRRDNHKCDDKREREKKESRDRKEEKKPAKSVILSISDRIQKRVADVTAAAAAAAAAASSDPPSSSSSSSTLPRIQQKLQEKARQSLQSTSKQDNDFKTTTQGGQSWEGRDMHATAEFLQEEEAHATAAEGALERQEARRKMIAAIEDEGVESLSQQTKVEGREGGRKGGACVFLSERVIFYMPTLKYSKMLLGLTSDPPHSFHPSLL